MIEDANVRRRPASLGRGLSALLGDSTADVQSGTADGVRMLPIAQIDANPEQPRHQFDEEALSELSQSIAAHGVLQPIVVRRRGGRYQIVAGERRWRAAQRAKLTELPVLVRDYDDRNMFEIALIENIQRADLNPIEEGDAYRRLIDHHGYTQDTLAQIVHKSRSHVANMMRLLDLPDPLREALSDGRLSMGHARALITADEPEALAEQVIQDKLSVRATEQLVKGARIAPPGQEPATHEAVEREAADGVSPKSEPQAPRPRNTEVVNDPDVALLVQHLGDLLGLKVSIAHRADGGGTVSLAYATLDQLDMLCQRLSGEAI